MSKVKCYVCDSFMIRYGKTSKGSQRWYCKKCGVSNTNSINNDAKNLSLFLDWLLSGKTFKDMPGKGRSFQRKTRKFWDLWVLPPLVDHVHDVVYVDGIHLGRKAVVLIACSDDYVLGWYVARSENSRAWKALLSRIAPPKLVVSDGGNGFMKACKDVWSDSVVQRCTFHVFMMIRTATTIRPKLCASKELYQLGKVLIRVKTQDEAIDWLKDYQEWSVKWKDFLAERTYHDGSWSYTHDRLVRVRSRLNRLISSGLLFPFVDSRWERVMPSMTNRIEGGVNAPLRQMLRDHRGLSLSRRIKAIFWWCYMHSEYKLSSSQILKTMPSDSDIETIYNQLTITDKLAGVIPQWGDAVAWHELHHEAPYKQDWD